MKKILVASKNPVKIKATRKGFRRMFPQEEFIFETLSTPSQVSRQPLSDRETLQGALNRARAIQNSIQADYWVGIEGGVDSQDGELAAFAWVVILGAGKIGKGRTGTFFLPPQVARLIREGMELGEADDIVFRRKNSKQDNGAVGLLTGDVIDRIHLYEQAVILALIPFKNTELYQGQLSAL